MRFSNEAKLTEFINAQYYQIFPHLDKIEIVIDKEQQKKGIDKFLILKSGKRISIDEKIRRKDYGDILLEEYSDFDRKVAGWLNKDKYTDYISYVVLPAEKIYLFPFLNLQLAWLKNYKNWLKQYGRRSAENNGWTTTNIPIPTEVLLNEISTCIVHKFC
jgi:hypothetical protein